MVDPLNLYVLIPHPIIDRINMRSKSCLPSNPTTVRQCCVDGQAVRGTIHQYGFIYKILERYLAPHINTINYSSQNITPEDSLKNC